MLIALAVASKAAFELFTSGAMLGISLYAASRGGKKRKNSR